MSRMAEKLRLFVIVNADGKAKLRQIAGKSMRQIERYLSGQVIPPARIGYQLAVTCGCTHEEALELAQEPSETKKVS